MFELIFLDRALLSTWERYLALLKDSELSPARGLSGASCGRAG